MQSAREKYMELRVDMFPANEHDPLIEQSGGTERKAELCLPYDLKIVCAMLDEGYSLKEMATALNECSLFAKYLQELTPEDRRQYADDVMERVNEIREHEIGKDFKLAEEFYLLRANGKNLNIAQEGDIVLSLLMEGFAPETVERILQTHGTASEYARALVRTCQKIPGIYAEIQSTDVSDIRTEKDVYFSVAKEYMRERGLSKFDVKSDRDIVRRMYAKGRKEDFIRNALHFSPVAAEPWRDKEQYVDAVCSYVLKKQKMKKGADNRYTLTASMYEEKMKRLLQALLKTNAVDVDEINRKYYDGIVARELLEEHQLRSNIERVIAEKSPQAKKEIKLSPKSRYASLIVSAAYAVLRAEYKLLQASAKQIPAGCSYSSLKKQGFSAADLYKDAILRRVHDYPSTAGMLTASFVDRDATEYLLSRYPDMDRFELEEALRLESPRAQMAGIGTDYPMSVVDEVYKRRVALEVQQEKQRAFRKDMEESIQLEKNAFTAGGPAWNLALCTGLAVVRILQSGYSPLDVLPSLIQPPDILEADASRIVEAAQNVIGRMAQIQSYKPFPDAEKKQLQSLELAKDEYKRLYQSMQAGRDRLMSKLDVEIARNMILAQYPKNDVIEAVRQSSPVAAEPGRDKDYAEYVEKQAEIAIEKERERLRYYRPMPRNEYEKDAEKEYEYHMNNMRSAFFLPYVPAMDVLIAETMIAQGFQAAVIGAAMQKLSPCAIDNEHYGRGIVRSLEARSVGFSRAMDAHVLVRTLDEIQQH
ncbi:MAG: hypothetical protein IKW79_04990 [Schwartzia sp.]|nr:hypothetical protein [Schwartzia sp. (in: firmicutes)]